MHRKPVLVGYDGSAEARLALRWALDEAIRSGSPVQLVYAFEWLTPGSWAGTGGWAVPGGWAGVGAGTGVGSEVWPDELARREVHQALKEAIAEAAQSHPGVTVRGEVLDGPPAPLLLERSAQAELVVLGSRGYGGFAGLLVGSTTVAVTAHAHCPVVVVREVSDDNRAGPIVVGVDGSPQSLLALDFAVRRAVDQAAPLHVLRARPAPGPWPRPAATSPGPVSTTMPEVAGEAGDESAAAERAALDALLARHRVAHPGLAVSTQVPPIGAAAALIEASRRARLTVVGTRGRGGFRGLLLGSVSQQVIQHGHGPVAVVRELATAAPEG